jgi:lysophospholipase L1-like esterase
MMRFKPLIILGLAGCQLVFAGVSDQYKPVPAPSPNGMLLKKGDRLAICGDSITEQKMYSRIIEDYLTACMPQLKIEVRQFGWGGERADGFLARMTNDCLRFNPTIATTGYGMNDHGYQPYKSSIGEAYRSNMLAVVQAFQAHGIRVVVGSPGTIAKIPWWEAGKYQVGDLNQNLLELRNIDVGIARQEKVGFADVYEPMLIGGAAARQKYGEKYELNGDDGIHPGWAGHTVMAYAFLKALGVNGEIANFTLNLANNKLTVSAGHNLLSAKDGVFTIRSLRYPFCSGAPLGMAADWYPTIGRDSITNSDSIRSGMTLVPFNRDLNRFMLTVKNAKADRYRVSWGKQGRVFTAEQLTKGINLAAEFEDNPFSTRFAMIDAAVDGKQAFETREVKNLFRVPGDKATMKQITEQTDGVFKDAEREHAVLEKAIRVAYAPVTYTLTVIPE